MLARRVDSSGLKPHSLVTCPWVKSLSVPIVWFLFHTALLAGGQTKTSSLPLVSSFWSGIPGHAPAKASLCSWKNNVNDMLRTGFSTSCFFLAHLYETPPHSPLWKKRRKKKSGRTTNSICCVMLSQTLCQVAALMPRHNWPSKLHKVVNEDRPCPWGEGRTVSVSPSEWHGSPAATKLHLLPAGARRGWHSGRLIGQSYKNSAVSVSRFHFSFFTLKTPGRPFCSPSDQANK